MTPLILALMPLFFLQAPVEPIVLTASKTSSIMELGVGGIFVLLVLDFVLRIISASNKRGGQNGRGAAGQETKQTVTVNADKNGNPGSAAGSIRSLEGIMLRVDARTERHVQDVSPALDVARRVDARTESQGKCMAEIGESLKTLVSASAQTNGLLQANLNRLTDLAARSRPPAGE